MLMKRQKHSRRFLVRGRKDLAIAVIGLTVLFILINAIVFVIYKDRTYPNTKVMGAPIGSTRFNDIAPKVDTMRLLPNNIALKTPKKELSIAAVDIGLSSNSSRTAADAKKKRSWLPLFNLFKSQELSAPLQFDAQKLAEKSPELKAALRADSVNARLNLEGAKVSILAEEQGYELEAGKLAQTITASLDKGTKSAINAPITYTRAGITKDQLIDDQKLLEAQLKTPITLRYNAKTKQAAPEDIAQWFMLSGSTYTISQPAVLAYVHAVGKEFGIRVKDSTAIAASLGKGVLEQKAVNQPLVHQIALKSYGYCVAARGVDNSHLAGLKTKLQEAYSSPKGWGLDGLIEFREVASGCDFTVWLSAAGQMPSFGAICDSLWSCRVGPNVVINFDRWQNASDAWNAQGGSLSDYRYMVINHETGHWLSFGHLHCSGPGQPAPVMQQQSIDLEGCVFNPWPTADEQRMLRQDQGI